MEKLFILMICYQNPKQLNNYQVFAIPGGFSYGDDTGSGNAMAKKIMTNLYDHLIDFSLKIN